MSKFNKITIIRRFRKVTISALLIGCSVAYTPAFAADTADDIDSMIQSQQQILAQLTQKLEVPARMLHARAEDAGQDPQYREKFDIATARAVANFNTLAEYCLPLVKVGGLFLALKGAAGEEELAAAAGAITKLGGRVEATHRYALPGGDARVLIVIRKEAPTPSRYPRTAALMKKSPLT